MHARAALRDIGETAISAGTPGAWPRRPRWLHTWGQRLLIILTVIIAATGVSAVHGHWIARAVIALGTLSLALTIRRPLIAWRILWIAVILAGVLRDAGNGLPPAPLVIAAIPILIAVAASQRLGIVVTAWVATCLAVLTAINTNNQAGVIVLVTILMLAGDQIRRRVTAQRSLASQEEQTAVLAERARIARELHDVVAHHVSLIAVRAETAPYRLTGLDQPARDEFTQISAAARESLTEMRGLLGVLRSEGQPAETAPQPGLTDITGLVDGAREAGATVTLTMPDQRTTTPAVGLAAYRIVQEALSNTVRHAPGAPASVTIDHTGTHLDVTVRSAPPPRTAPAPKPGDTPARAGHGLLGMRERAAMLGGELSAEREPTGDFVVHARLPIGGDT